MKNKFIQIVKQNLANKKVLVVGDVMLDRYWFGDVARISPEAPVPIAKISRIEDRPGGAANVARNIASLGGTVSLLSVVGNDAAAQDLIKILERDNVHNLLKHDDNIHTIVKLRVLARNQQLIRLDFEELPTHEILAEVLETYIAIIDDYDVVILSDYGKGGLSHTAKMIEIANKAGKKVLIDPKGADYSKYANAYSLTPNRSELRDVAGGWANTDDMLAKAQKLRQELNLQHLMLTRSEEGISLVSKDSIHNYPTVACEVYDVSGAGDTVIATFGLMLANGVDVLDAVQIANVAAGVVVGKLGTAKVTKDELLLALVK